MSLLKDCYETACIRGGKRPLIQGLWWWQGGKIKDSRGISNIDSPDFFVIDLVNGMTLGT